MIKELAAFQNQSSAVLITTEDLRCDGFNDHPEFNCLVADDHHTIIGITFYSYGYSIWVGKSIKLDDLVVKDNQRGNGIGFQLLDKLIKIAQDEQIRRLSWLVYD